MVAAWTQLPRSCSRCSRRTRPSWRLVTGMIASSSPSTSWSAAWPPSRTGTATSRA